jgi:voltage-gated potassium channel
MQKRPLLVLAALAAAAEPDYGRAAFERLKLGITDKYQADPIGTTATTVLVASWLFYRAERAHNPKVNSFYAALEYVTSSLSVGYTDIYPKTATGKTIASTLMTFGPSMAAGLLDERQKTAAVESPSQSAIVERLDRILAVLEKRSAREPV